MTETFCTSDLVKLKVGVNGTILSSAQYTSLINQAESYLNAVMRINLIDTYSSLNADAKLILEDAASSHAAIAAINYLTEDWNLSVAQTLLNVNYTRLTDAITLLKDKNTTLFIQEA